MSDEEFVNDAGWVRKHLTRYEMLGQLAEELTELAQVCLKMQRLSFIHNKPRKEYRELLEDFNEECADVSLCLNVLGIDDCDKISEIIDRKLERWKQNIMSSIAQDIASTLED